jgi:hypothetical protein
MLIENFLQALQNPSCIVGRRTPLVTISIFALGKHDRVKDKKLTISG